MLPEVRPVRRDDAPVRRVRRREEGVGTVLVIGLLGAVAMMLLSALALGAAVVAGHRAAAAADLAALAGATRAITGDAAGVCDAAWRIAAANGARLVGCRLDGEDVMVQVQVPVAGALPGTLGRLPPATGRSRAGPQDAQAQ